MSSCKLVWITGNAQHLVAQIARVSNPSNQANEDIEHLLAYMIRNQHWSPFEMVSACFEINTTRDIARQILRHRSFSFQEFSQRYGDPSELGYELREARLKHPTNRQSSIELEKEDALQAQWNMAQQAHYERALILYQEFTKAGLAKEVARSVLPEGMTMSRMYMSGTLRSWIHYTQLRTGNGTQKEHQEIACEINSILQEQVPIIWKALERSSKPS